MSCLDTRGENWFLLLVFHHKPNINLITWTFTGENGCTLKETILQYAKQEPYLLGMPTACSPTNQYSLDIKARLWHKEDRPTYHTWTSYVKHSKVGACFDRRTGSTKNGTFSRTLTILLPAIYDDNTTGNFEHVFIAHPRIFVYTGYALAHTPTVALGAWP